MIYIGNGIYSDSGPNDYLQHYGVLGMKWGVHKAKNHLKLLRKARRFGESGYRTRENSQEANEQYKKELEEVKNFARSNKKNGTKVKDIENIARNKAREEFGENYDRLYKKRQVAKGVTKGLLGLSAAGLVAGTVAQNKANRNYEKKNGIKTKLDPFHSYTFNTSANKKLETAGAALGAVAGSAAIPEIARKEYERALIADHWKKRYNK